MLECRYYDKSNRICGKKGPNISFKEEKERAKLLSFLRLLAAECKCTIACFNLEDKCFLIRGRKENQKFLCRKIKKMTQDIKNSRKRNGRIKIRRKQAVKYATFH